MWKEITIAGYKICAKVYKETSPFGIKGAEKISKLWIKKNGKVWLNYDRGMDFNHLPEFTFKAIIKILNHIF